MFSPISRSLWIDFNSDPSASDPTIYQLRKIGLSILVPWASVSALFTWQGFRPNWIDPPALKEQVSRNAPPQSFSCPPLARLPFSSRSDKGNLGGGVREVKGRRPRGITQHAPACVIPEGGGFNQSRKAVASATVFASLRRGKTKSGAFKLRKTTRFSTIPEQCSGIRPAVKTAGDRLGLNRPGYLHGG